VIYSWPTRLAAALIAATLTGVSTAEPVASLADNSDCLDVESYLFRPAGDSLGTRTRNWLRRKFVCEDDLACYGIQLDECWLAAEPDKPVVLVVHGYNSTPARNEPLAEAIRGAGFPCGHFAYPNDYTIPASTQLLSAALRHFASEHPRRRVVLVCHSMGGIVARACVEDALYDPGNVDKLILIAPPTRGTAVAHFAIATDVWEHWLARREGNPWERFHDSVVDGLGEAACELCPDSPLLRELNGRPRNPRIAYSVILGTGACLTDGELAWVRDSIVRRLARWPGIASSATRLHTLLGDLDELVEGRGDGVVAVDRGRLRGVGDTLVLPFGHLAVTGEPTSDVVRQVQQAVIQRLN